MVLISHSTDSLVRYYLEVGEIEETGEICSAVRDTFLLGEIAYFNYKFEQAIELYSKVQSESKDKNDALLRTILIKENNNKELQDYVTAELLGRKKRFADGIRMLKNLQGADTDTKVTHTIASWASILLIELLNKDGKPNEAIQECKNFIKDYPEDEKLPQVKLKMGKIYTTLGKRKEAIEIYKEILLKHPDSSVAPIAREELENL